jgi:DNA-binding XRE family transcriptional regulator
LSDALVYLRRRDGLSQDELAKLCNVSRSTIGMMESDRRNPSREVLEAIADVFNTTTDFLVGREDTGEYSGVFRKTLGEILSKRSTADMEAAGIDTYELGLIVDGTLSLTFNRACEIADELGETLDFMLGREKPTPVYEDGLNDTEKLLMRYVRDLSSGQQQMLLAQMQVMIESQKKSSLSSVQE